MSLAILPSGKLQVWNSAGPNVNVAANMFDPAYSGGFPPNVGVILFTSNRACPMNTSAPTPGDPTGWTHVCLKGDLRGAPQTGKVQLFINGCPDNFATGNFTGGNLLTRMWHNETGPDEIYQSQFLVSDSAGPDNTSNISQFARIITLFPTSDVLTGWSAGFAGVDANPGPPAGLGAGLSTLTSPYDIFGFPSGGSAYQSQVPAVALNMSLKAPSAQTIAGIVKNGSPFATATLAALQNTGFGTLQGIMEREPLSSGFWTKALVDACQFGFAGISGTGEFVNQHFLEILTQQGIARCGASAYAY
jgi:hypothetical protein